MRRSSVRSPTVWCLRYGRTGLYNIAYQDLSVLFISAPRVHLLPLSLRRLGVPLRGGQLDLQGDLAGGIDVRLRSRRRDVA